ncbi:hypothetical protein BDY19DRAFT_575821 [Irpex rosettiformis]|uniref:Uncharacterized protein n=1 Tax=Irpex rosettiformis TaxID=378272 RepID=A0ACB8UDL0_9APHY|nr:hypothetical protein BDY19DRAFT_575821 [Irpex rosettiformis]
MEDASDILGGQLNVAQHGASQPWTDITFLALLYYIVLTISLGMAVYFLQPYYAQLRDRRYRKNLRRRHGIPDHDRRPFNLAFAAAKKAHLNRDSKESTPSTVNTMASAGSQTTVLQRQISRQRLNGAIFQALQEHAKQVMKSL